jgi:outer membrane protein TolC
MTRHLRTAAGTLVCCALWGGVALGQRADEGAPVALGSPVELTLRAAIELALRENLDLRVERYGLDASDLRIWGARGVYDPLVGFSLGSSSSSTPTTSILQGGGVATETMSGNTFGPSVRQRLPTGGTLSASFTNSRTSTNNAFSFVDPLFGSGLTVSVAQPLLSGLFNDPARRQLRLLNLDSKITDAQFRQAVSEVVERVQAQYWSLVYAQEAHEARRESRDLAVKQRDQIGQKVQAGLLTPVALTSASAEVAIRDQEVLQAEVQIVAAQNGLKRLLAGDPSAALWTARLVPVDRPALVDPPASLGDALARALERRPELDALALRLEQNETNRRALRWDVLPEVSVSASLSSIGRAGHVFQPIFDASGGIVPSSRVPNPTHPGFGGYRKAWDQVFGYDYPSWNVGLDVQVPIFNRSIRSQAALADVDRRRLETEVKRQRQAIMVEVANAHETVQLQRKVVDVARLARELSQEQVRGETARFEVGFTTNFEVLRYQRDLGDARVRELRAMVDYQIALAALQKAMGVLLDDNDLTIARSPR